MTTPKISVCMPMFNASRYLRECIDSILAQTFTDFELLIADDGSTDNSVEIVESYTDPRIRLIRRPHDYIATLNCLLSEARGEYIARMDADDVMLPNRLEEQMSILQERQDIDILSLEYPLLSPCAKSYNLVKLNLANFAEYNCIAHLATIMRRDSIICKSIKYEYGFCHAEDYKFWVDSLIAGLNLFKGSINVITKGLPMNCKSEKIYHSTRVSERAVAKFCQDYLANKANSSYVMPTIPSTNKKITIIIPYLNEGKELINTVANIRSICGSHVEIMVINDHSYDCIDYASSLAKYDVIYLYNKERCGVAASRDMGVSLMMTPYFLLLDGHMRLYNYNDIESIIKFLDNDDRCILCGQSIPLDDQDGNLVLREEYSKGYGAFSPMRKGRLLPDIEWCQEEHNSMTKIEEIPAILGAAYAGSKRYWTYLRGLEGLMSYGLDENLLSFKVWLEGGRCLLIKDFITGHLYRKKSPYFTLTADKVFNSLYLCTLFYGTRELNRTHAYALATDFEAHRAANKIYQSKTHLINEIKAYCMSISTRDIQYVRSLHTVELGRTIQLMEIEMGNSIFQSKDYIKFLINRTNHISLLDGLGAIILFIISNKNLLQEKVLLSNALSKYYNLINIELQKETPSLAFFEGLSGIGWLLLQYPINNDGNLINRIQDNIDRRITSLYSDNNMEFGHGIGGVLCFAITCLSSNSYLNNPDYWIKLYQISQNVVTTPNYDEETYFFAMQYLSLINNTTDEPGYMPTITDWLTLPDRFYKSGSISLKDGELGYELLKLILNKKAAAYV